VAPRGSRVLADLRRSDWRARPGVGLDRDCRPENRDTVRCIVEELESVGEELDAELLREFMVFTNDLDVTRKQSFRSACPELLGHIESAGFAWTDETRYAFDEPAAAAVSA